MSLRPTVLLLSAALAVTPSSAALVARAQLGGTRTVYVTALNDKGVPVKDLAAADFIVKEDGKGRAVMAATITTVPLTVALMLDDSGVGLQSIREGAAAFITRLRGLGRIALVTTGGRNIKALDYTDSTGALMSALNRTFARNTAGAYLLDGLADIAKEFMAREIARPVIVSIAVEGDENSQIRAEEVLAILQRSSAQVYLVRLGRPVVGQSNALGLERGESRLDEATQANAVLGQAPSRSGGRIEQLAVHTGIPKLLEQIAGELATQYAVTYEATTSNSSDLKLAVSTSRKGVKVRAPTRVGPPKP